MGTLKQSLIYDETNIGKKSLKGTVKATISENPSEEFNITRDKEKVEEDQDESDSEIFKSKIFPSKIFPAKYSDKAYSKSKPLNTSIPAKSPAKNNKKKDKEE